ncbi:MAG: flagellar basal-body MS-ring/collar protein FliF [Gemmatimonas sp.]
MASFSDSLFGRMSGGRQVAIIAVGVIVTGAVFGVSRWATQPTMVPLYADMPAGQVKKVTDKLTELGITHELDVTGTTVLVASTDMVKARVDLAAEAMPGDGRPGLELFDKPSWGMTDFTQKVNYRRALEGELERTIGKMKNIEAVQVHLALEDDKLFKESERPSKASVTLTMSGGDAPKAETVQGIASLVASSVGGLDPEHVTIVDSRGQALTLQDEGSMAGLTSRQLAVQREVESHMEQKADRLLSSLVGSGNARVQVSASINFDKIERTTQAVDPDKQALATEQKSEVTPSSPQQGAGYTQTATSYENTRSTENFSGAIGNLKKLTVAVLIADKVTRAPGSDTSAKAAAIPPTVTTRTTEELTRIETLMRNALGVDSARGDMISVVSAPFDIPAPLVVRKDSIPAPDMIARLQSNPKPLVAVAALVVLLVIAVLMLSALKPKKGVPQQAGNTRLPSGNGYPELPASSQMHAALQGSREMEQMQSDDRRQVILPPTATNAEREQAMATVDQRPDAAMRVTRGWLRT